MTNQPAAEGAAQQRLGGLRQDEQYAARALESITEATATAHDVNGRQRAVDVLLSYPGGRVGALEVTTIGDNQEFQRDALLARDNHAWPNPGNWAWTVHVADARDIPRLRQVLSRVILTLEAAGATQPENLPFAQVHADPDLWWLYTESKSDVFGHPGAPSFVDTHGNRYVSVLPAGGGGGVDTHLTSLPAIVEEIFTRPLIVEHARKLVAFEASERHLFLRVGQTGIPMGLYLGMMKPEGVPAEPAALPEGITDLWLKIDWGQALVHWSRRDNWRVHELGTSHVQPGAALE